jgi:plastocyanin
VKILRTLAVVLVALAVFVGAGCGGDDGGGDTTSATTETTETTTGTTTEPEGSAGGGGTTRVKMDEFSFEPEDVTVSRGDTITVENDGAAAHNLTIEQGSDPNEKSEKLAGTSTFLGGKSEDLTVDVQPGKYSMVCTVSGHRDAGMVGTITVE